MKKDHLAVVFFFCLLLGIFRNRGDTLKVYSAALRIDTVFRETTPNDVQHDFLCGTIGGRSHSKRIRVRNSVAELHLVVGI